MDNNPPRATASDWPHRPLPAAHTELPLDGAIAPADMARIARGYIPRTPQDKWFVYYDGVQLHFHRAATGACIFQLNIEAHDDHFVTPSVLVNRDPAQYRTISDGYDVELLAYLIDRLLLGRNPPFPQPHGLGHAQRDEHRRHVLGGGGDDGGAGGFIRLDDL